MGLFDTRASKKSPKHRLPFPASKAVLVRFFGLSFIVHYLMILLAKGTPAQFSTPVP
jgi:hypothetical protein